MSFGGFPARPQSTAIPNVFFSDLLPKLAGDPATLGVALFAFNALQRKKGFPRYVTPTELSGEPGLQSYLAGSSTDAPAIDRGLAALAELGMLRALTVERDGMRTELYFLNAPADLRGLEAIRSGDIDLGRIVERAPQPAPERSSIFSLYEQLVGTISPLVSDELADAERLYPAEWLEAAFREAAAQNARSWRYVSKILERWAVEGPDHAKIERSVADAGSEDRYFAGKYGRILKGRLKP